MIPVLRNVTDYWDQYGGNVDENFGGNVKWYMELSNNVGGKGYCEGGVK
jgi:hypothetical protein